jgi:hypothetical protein
VAQILKMAQLVDENGMAEMQIGRRGIEPGLDPQRTSHPESVDQFGLQEQFIAASLNEGQIGFKHAITSSFTLLFCVLIVTGSLLDSVQFFCRREQTAHVP